LEVTLAILAALTLTSAVAVFCFRQLVHCAFALVLTFFGLAGLYILLGAEFIGLAQVLVYVGAVAILIVFALLITQSLATENRRFDKKWWLGLGIALLVLFGLGGALIGTSQFKKPSAQKPAPLKVRTLGEKMMLEYLPAVEVLGLLLTAALIGAAIIASPAHKEEMN
jgi:NADH-quinone oxidoreductase subunit J